jgi:hypothetical protein
MNARPFAYTPGVNVPGTDKVGDISYGHPTSGFEGSEFEWWNGPDEELGYIIAKSISDDSQPTPVSGVTASVGFNRSALKTEASFIELVNDIFDQTFATGDDAKDWLNTNGYWTSWGITSTGGTFGTGDYKLSEVYAPAPMNGDITFPAHPLIPGPGYGILNPNLVGIADSNYSYQLYFNPYDINGNDRSSVLDNLIGKDGTLTLTQGNNFIVYGFTYQAFINAAIGPGSSSYFYDSQFGAGPNTGGISPLGSLTVITPSLADFNNIDPISISITNT